MKVIVYLETGNVEFKSNEEFHMLIDRIYKEYPENIGFKIIKAEDEKLKLRRRNCGKK